MCLWVCYHVQKVCEHGWRECHQIYMSGALGDEDEVILILRSKGQRSRSRQDQIWSIFIGSKNAPFWQRQGMSVNSMSSKTISLFFINTCYCRPASVILTRLHSAVNWRILLQYLVKSECSIAHLSAQFRFIFSFIELVASTLKIKKAKQTIVHCATTKNNTEYKTRNEMQCNAMKKTI